MLKNVHGPGLANNLRLFTVASVMALLIGLIVVTARNLPPTVAMLGTATPTDTPSPTSTATATYTPTATPTSTYTPSPSATSTTTPTSSPTSKSAATRRPTSKSAATATATATPAGTPTPTDTPTPTPTPVPRTILASSLDLPDPAKAEDHFWFTRPFSGTFAAWGSPYYPFGTNNRGEYLWHHGVDIQNPMGTPILAVGDGVVARAGPDDVLPFGPSLNFFGQAVLIRHTKELSGQSVYSLYGHVSKVLAREGQPVKAGDVVAEVGQAGIALGPHLHLEIRVGGTAYEDVRNPDLWVKPDQGYGVVAGRVIDARGYMVPQQPIFLHRAEQPERFWRQTFTYPDNEVKSDPTWGETFTFADVPAGGYVLKTFFDGQLYTRPISVTNQAITFVLIQGAARSPTSTPSAQPPNGAATLPAGTLTPTALPRTLIPTPASQ